MFSSVCRASVRRSPGARWCPELLEQRILLAAELVLDIEPSTEGSFDGPGSVLAVGDTAYFTADDSDVFVNTVVGAELWKSDGVTTTLVKDIYPGYVGSNPANFTDFNGTLFFTVERSMPDGAGRGLWKSDGTADGTVEVKRVEARDLEVVGDVLYFTLSGSNLWKSDGTTDGTVPVFESPRGGIENLTAVGGTLMFIRNDGVSGFELWKSDGTAEGTVLVKDIRPGPQNSSPRDLVGFDGTLLFVADDGAGTALWRSDGTPEGTIKLSAVRPGSQPYAQSIFKEFDFTRAAGAVFFVSEDAASGSELWKTDGTAEGTVRVMEIRPGSAGSNPAFLDAVGDLLYFSADDGVRGAELWRSDGTEAGTVLVKDIDPAAPFTLPTSGSSSPGAFTDFGDYFLFRASDGPHGPELWRSDGTAAGTQLVKDIRPGAAGSIWGQFTRISDRLVFIADDGVTGPEPWVSDGTAAGTRLLFDLNAVPYSSDPAAGTVIGDVLYFSAETRAQGAELWRTDGTAAGTWIVKELPGTDGFFGNYSPVTAAVGDTLFAVGRGAEGYGLWKSDGTTAGTVLVKPLNTSALASVGNMTASGGLLYYTVSDWTRTPYTYQLWRSDGTPDGTFALKTYPAWFNGSYQGPEWLVDFKGTLYFSGYDPANGAELWKSDGTPEGTTLVRDINPGPDQSVIRSPIAMGDWLYFSAFDGATPGLWKTDGTTAGTSVVKPVRIGHSEISRHMVRAGDTLFFSASDDATGIELWKSDGTDAGTVLVRDVAPGTASLSIDDLIAVGDRVFFTGYDGRPNGWNFWRGNYLWTSDGTAEGTVLVKAISELPKGEWISYGSMADVGGTLFFTAQTAEAGPQVWRSDGTDAGTVPVTDLDQRRQSHELMPYFLGVIGGDTLLFSPYEGVHGRELWRVQAPPPPPVVTGRHLFYNNSVFDGRDPAASAADLAAIAPDKTALLPGTRASAANVSSYARGINGVFVDLAGVGQAALGPDDFEFRVGRGGDPGAWAAAPPASVTRLAGPAAAGVTRYAITWPDGAVRNTWLRVTVEANDRTGLAAPDVFYFGNLVGDTGLGGAGFAAAPRVDALDVRRLRSALGTAAAIASPFDFDRDGRVTALDLAAARNNLGRSLALWTAPPAPRAWGRTASATAELL